MQNFWDTTEGTNECTRKQQENRYKIKILPNLDDIRDIHFDGINSAIGTLVSCQ